MRIRPPVGSTPMTDDAGGDDLADWPLTTPHTARLPSDHPRRAEILAAHAAALEAAELGYLDPDTGLFVLTARFLADRGYCCGRGCRHCPYLAD
jgi:hypothetical protein